MRVVLLVVGLLTLDACAQPAPTPVAQNTGSKSDKSDLNRFVEPTNGAAYSQSNMNYYRENAGGYLGPGVVVKSK